MSQRIKKAGRRYAIEFFAAMALYVIVLISALTIAKPLAPGPLLTVLALAPLVPIILAATAFFRFYENMDELQRRIIANAAAITLVIGILAAIALGFLKRFGVIDFEDDIMLFGPFLIGVWGAVRFFLGGRDC